MGTIVGAAERITMTYDARRRLDDGVNATIGRRRRLDDGDVGDDDDDDVSTVED